MALVLSLQAIHIHPLLRECQEHSSTRMDCHGRRRCGSTERRGEEEGKCFCCVFFQAEHCLYDAGRRRDAA